MYWSQLFKCLTSVSFLEKCHCHWFYFYYVFLNNTIELKITVWLCKQNVCKYYIICIHSTCTTVVRNSGECVNIWVYIGITKGFVRDRNKIVKIIIKNYQNQWRGNKKNNLYISYVTRVRQFMRYRYSVIFLLQLHIFGYEYIWKFIVMDRQPHPLIPPHNLLSATSGRLTCIVVQPMPIMVHPNF